MFEAAVGAKVRGSQEHCASISRGTAVVMLLMLEGCAATSDCVTQNNGHQIHLTYPCLSTVESAQNPWKPSINPQITGRTDHNCPLQSDNPGFGHT
jgi:hypothetical protein